MVFKKLKSLFVVDDEEFLKNSKKEAASSKSSDKSVAAPKSRPSTSTPAQKPTSQPPTVRPSARVDPKKMNTKFVDILLKAIDAQNMDGFDYLEFKQSLQSLKNVEPDKGKRIQSAFAVSQTLGATRKNLLQSGEFYLGIIDKEYKKFIESYNKQKAQQVTGSEQRLKQMQTSIKEKEQQIVKLQKEIATLKEQLAKQNEQKGAALEKIEATKDGFLLAYEQIQNQINNDLANIKQFVKE